VKHGTGTAYTRHGCRCADCRAYKATKARERYAAKHSGEEPKCRHKIDEVQRHIARMKTLGMSSAGIARQAGVSVDCVTDITAGKPAYVTTRTRDSILGVSVDNTAYVPGWKVRLLAAHIERAGVDVPEIARALKMNPASCAVTLHRKTHTRRTLDKYVILARYLAGQGIVPASVLEEVA